MPERFIENRLLQAAERMRSNKPASFAFAVGSAIIATAVRFWADPYLSPGFPFLTYFPAVVLTGLFAGTFYGCVCVVLCALAAWYWFIPPFGGFDLTPHAAVAMIFFLLVGAVDLTILHVMNKAVNLLRRQRDLSHKLAAQQKVLFQELQHRVANNLNFVSNLLAIHQARMPADSDGAQGLNDARIRLETMSRVHRKLYDSSNVDLKLNQYLSDLCEDILHASGADTRVQITVETPPVYFDLEKLLNISLVIVEAVTNALKHAFPSGRRGQIAVRLVEKDNHYILSIKDNGSGFPESFNPDGSSRLGVRILQSFTRALQGQLAFGNDKGGVVTVTFSK